MQTLVALSIVPTFLGKGAIIEGLEARFGARIPKAGLIGAVVVIGGTIAYFGALQEMENIREVMLDKFQSGEASDEDFRKVFGEQVDPTLVKKYWEM